MEDVLRIADENSQGRDADGTASFLAAPCLLNVDKLLPLHQTGSVVHCEKIWLSKTLQYLINANLKSEKVMALPGDDSNTLGNFEK